jgi:uncharacterized protein (DUF427 family)
VDRGALQYVVELGGRLLVARVIGMQLLDPSARGRVAHPGSPPGRVRREAITHEPIVVASVPDASSPLGETAWFEVVGGTRHAARAAWQHVALPDHAAILEDKVALAWRAMDAFYEEDERILGHAADPYHRIDIRRTSRHLVVRAGDRVVADTTTPLVLYESGFAPRWYVPRDDVVAEALTREDLQTFCPYKGIASY